jgi:hypothetical protein
VTKVTSSEMTPNTSQSKATDMARSDHLTATPSCVRCPNGEQTLASGRQALTSPVCASERVQSTPHRICPEIQHPPLRTSTPLHPPFRQMFAVILIGWASNISAVGGAFLAENTFLFQALRRLAAWLSYQ